MNRRIRKEYGKSWRQRRSTIDSPRSRWLVKMSISRWLNRQRRDY